MNNVCNGLWGGHIGSGYSTGRRLLFGMTKISGTR